MSDQKGEQNRKRLQEGDATVKYHTYRPRYEHGWEGSREGEQKRREHVKSVDRQALDLGKSQNPDVRGKGALGIV